VPDHAKRLREMAEAKLYRAPSRRVDQQFLESVQALRAGANAIEKLKALDLAEIEAHRMPDPKP
jgi:hypothetical protein